MQNIAIPPRSRALRSLPGLGMAAVLAAHCGVMGAAAAGVELDDAPLWLVRVLMSALAVKLIRRIAAARRGKTRLAMLPLAFWTIALSIAAWLTAPGPLAWILFGLQTGLVLGIALATIRRDGIGPLSLGWDMPMPWRLNAQTPSLMPVHTRPLEPVV